MTSKNLALKDLLQTTALIISLASFQLPAPAQWTQGYQAGQSQSINNATNIFTNTDTSNSNSLLNNPLANFINSRFAGSPQDARNGAGGLASNPNIINSGTAITGVLQEDISSKTSKNADVFSIMLPENYTVNDRLLIPQYSKFVGTIVAAAPGKKASHGNPGNLQVSIQALVSPSGISIPVTAFIDYNPNQNPPTDVKKSRGIPIGEWTNTVVHSGIYLAGNVAGRMGAPNLYNGQTQGGKDFSLSKGEFLPVRLTEPMDVTPLLVGQLQMQTGARNWMQPGNSAPNQYNGFTGSNQSNNFAAPNQANNFAAPNQGNSFAAPNQASNFAAPNQANNFAAPNQGNSFAAPNQASNFAAPNQANNFAAPIQNNSFAAPPANIPSNSNLMPGTASPAGPEPF